LLQPRPFLKAHPHLKMSQILSVEVSSLDELQEALDQGTKRVLLDNMSPEQVSQCIQKISTNSSIGASECFVEVSGGITLENLNGYLINGVNAISTGALTHSARNVDLSLEFTD
jgi:nicotinate-nucleotide pyrophosphorylase (carboxylating)